MNGVGVQLKREPELKRKFTSDLIKTTMHFQNYSKNVEKLKIISMNSWEHHYE